MADSNHLSAGEEAVLIRTPTKAEVSHHPKYRAFLATVPLFVPGTMTMASDLRSRPAPRSAFHSVLFFVTIFEYTNANTAANMASSDISPGKVIFPT